MKPARKLALAALGLTLAGVAVALIVSLAVPRDPDSGRLPAAARALPADTGVLVGADVAALRDAGLMERLAAWLPSPPALSDHLDWERVDRVFWAHSGNADDATPGVLLALGRFEGDLGGDPTEAEDGSLDWTLPSEAGGPALALHRDASATRLLAGTPEKVAATRQTLATGGAALPDELLPPLDALPPTASVWLVAGPAAMERLRGAASATELPLPPLPELRGAALGVEPGTTMSADLVVLAADDDGARSFAETARGLLALAQLTARPELRAALSELALSQEGALVRLRVRLPPERLAALWSLLQTP